jgi:hypothetical protein
MTKLKLKRNTKESDIQYSILQYLNTLQQSLPIYFFRSNSGAFNIVDKAGNQRFMKTGKKGCPDIILCAFGKFIGIEVKNEKGSLSEYQKQTCLEIDKAGGIYLTVRSVVELIADLNTIKDVYCK